MDADGAPSSGENATAEARRTSPPNGQVSAELRSRRSKYVANACQFCQKRKIKCNGESPCQPCNERNLQCSRHAASATGKPSKKPHTSLTDASHPNEQHRVAHCPPGPLDAAVIEASDPTAHDLLSKITDLQAQVLKLTEIADRQLETGSGPTASGPSNNTFNSLDFSVASSDGDYVVPRERTSLSDLPEDVLDPDALGDDSSSCSRALGETSIDQTLQQVELGLKTQQDLAHSVRRGPPSATVSQHLHRTYPGRSASSCTRLRLTRLIQQHDLQPREDEWDEIFSTFCEYVYPLFPFLHIPALEATYAEIWTLIRHDIHGRLETVEPTTDELAQVLICLALGRCTRSVRTLEVEGSRSAGWKFYTAATELVGPLLDPLHDLGVTVSRLQTLTSMAWYLIRLEAHELAQKIVAMAVSQAQCLGLHREGIVENMPIFVSELARRVWYTIYILDRRLALDAGRPFMIQDCNVDTGLPNDFRKSWFDKQRTTDGVMKDMRHALKGDIYSVETTTISYMRVMIGFSRLVGKVWDVVYHAEATGNSCSRHYSQECEAHLCAWVGTLPPQLTCDVASLHDIGPSDLPWQIRQRFLILIRVKWLRLLLLRPLQSRNTSRNWKTDCDVSAAALSLADSIVTIYAEVLDLHQLYHFPFLQYLMGAASIILGIVVRKSQFKQHYGGSIACATRLIQTFCQKTWVSGKTVRTVDRFTTMAARVFGTNDTIQLSTQDASASSLPPLLEAMADTDQVRNNRFNDLRRDNPDSPGSVRTTANPMITQMGIDGGQTARKRAHDGHDSFNGYRTRNARTSHIGPAGSEAVGQSFDTDMSPWSLFPSDFPFEVGIGSAFDNNTQSRVDAQMSSSEWNADLSNFSALEFPIDTLFDFGSGL